MCNTFCCWSFDNEINFSLILLIKSILFFLILFYLRFTIYAPPIFLLSLALTVHLYILCSLHFNLSPLDFLFNFKQLLILLCFLHT